MAVSVNTVYQKVLALANKEQRGYITPQEFNLFADHAQKEIFEQYFYDVNQFKRIPGNNTDYSDMINNLEEKISLFEVYNKQVDVNNTFGGVDLGTEIPDLYRLGMVRVRYNMQDSRIAEEIQLKDLPLYGDSALTRWSKKRPVYTRYNTDVDRIDRLRLYPAPSNDNTVDRVLVSYVRKPLTPKWGYVVVNNKALYNGSAADLQDFELHASEESELVYRILFMAGVAIEKPQLSQFAAQSQSAAVQQEKQ